jgi:hypothetical protein
MDAARQTALELRQEIDRFHPEVFNMDEAAFFFRRHPSTPLR